MVVIKNKVVSLMLIFVFMSTPNFAHEINGSNFPGLPAPGTRVLPSTQHSLPVISGMRIHPDNPYKFDFVISAGDDYLKSKAFKAEAQKLINYFLAGLTVPADQMWVNLSPYEKDRIIADKLALTDLGRDMLAQDYMLKQFTASLMYPEDPLGDRFWTEVYTKAQAMLGTTEIPINTFNKVWIIPEQATVTVNGNIAFVTDSHLKVILEKDYLALENNVNSNSHGLGNMTRDEMEVINGESKKIIREIMLPVIEREVNHGRNFANLRQIYNSVILATWYKKHFRANALGKMYIDQNKVNGITLADKRIKQKVYQQYVAALKKGVYNYVSEERDPVTKSIILRKHFSGGLRGPEDVATKRAPPSENPNVNDKLVSSVLKPMDNSENDPDEGGLVKIKGAVKLYEYGRQGRVHKNQISPILFARLKGMEKNIFLQKQKEVRAKLQDAGIAEADIDEALVEIFAHLSNIEPNLNTALLYRAYRKHRKKIIRDAQFGQNVANSWWPYERYEFAYTSEEFYETFKYERARTQANKYSSEKTDVENDPVLWFLKDYLGLDSVYIKETAFIAGGLLHSGLLLDRGSLVKHRELFYRFEDLIVVRFYLAVGPKIISEILSMDSKVRNLDSVLEIRILGENAAGDELGNKEKGFRDFTILQLPFPPGIVLSADYVKAVLAIDEKKQRDADNFYIEHIKKELRKIDVNPDKDDLYVRSNPKLSMPGILTTVKARKGRLLEAIRTVADAWSSPAAKGFRSRQNIDDKYDLPIILQKGISARKPFLLRLKLWFKAFFGKTQEHMFASGVFTTRHPDTGDDVLHGTYIENSDGSALMTGGRTGSDINDLRHAVPAVYGSLMEAKEKLERHRGVPQEVEFVVHDGNTFFLQTRNMMFSAQGEVNFLRDLVEKGKISEQRALPRIVQLTKRLKGRKIYKLKENFGRNPAIGEGLYSTPGSFQGYAVFTLRDAREYMAENKPIVFILNPINKDYLLPVALSYPRSGIITLYGNSSSHEAVLSRAAGVPSIINLPGTRMKDKKLKSFKSTPKQGPYIQFTDQQTLQPKTMVVIDGESRKVYLSEEPAIEEVGIIEEVTFGVDIWKYEEDVKGPFLERDGSIKKKITVARLTQEHQTAGQDYAKEVKQDVASKAAFLANLKQHFLHQLLTQKMTTEHQAARKDPGGIDFNSEIMNLNEEGQLDELKFRASPSAYTNPDTVGGMQAIITNITSAANFTPLVYR